MITLPETDTAILALTLRRPPPEADLETLRSPVIPVPDFVTVDWLKRHVTLTARDVRLLHGGYATMFSTDLGLAWPTEKPSVEAVYGLLVEGLRRPYFWPHFYDAFGRIRGARHKLMDAVLRRFFLKNSALDNKKADRLLICSATFAGGKNIAEFLQRGGDREAARAMVVLEWACRKDAPADAEEAAKDDPALGPYVSALLMYKTTSNAAKIKAAMEARNAPASEAAGGERIEVPLISASQAQSVLATRAAVRDAWMETIAGLSRRIGAAVAPDPALSADLIAAAEELRRLSALDETFAKTPKPATAILERLRATAAALAGLLRAMDGAEPEALLAEFELAMIAARSDADAQACAQAAAGAEESEARLAEAQAAHDAIESPDADQGPTLAARVERMTRLLARGKEAAEAGLRAALNAARRLGEEAASGGDPGGANGTGAATEDAAASTERRAPSARPEIGSRETPTVANGAQTVKPFPSSKAQARLIERAAPAQEAAAPVPVRPHDARAEEIAVALERLTAAGAFGLAHHLSRAAVRLPEPVAPPWTAEELHLAAVAGRVGRAPERDLASWRAALEAGVETARMLAAAPDGPHAGSRRALLLASVLPAALLPGPDERIARDIIETVGCGGSCSMFFEIVNALEENQRRDYPLNAATLREAQEASRATAEVEKLIASVRGQMEVMRKNRADIGFEGKIKTWLRGPDGAVGLLAKGLEANPVDAARRFVETIADREKALAAIEVARREVNHGHHAPLDGSLREALVASLLKLADLCRDLAAATALPKPGSAAAAAQRVRAQIRCALDRACEAAPPGSDPLLASAFAHARSVLASMRDILDGVETQADPLAPALALHAPLLRLSGLFWNGAWSPSATTPEAIVRAVLAAAPEEVLGPGNFADAIAARRAEGAFVAAHMLLAAADRFGVSREQAETLAIGLAAEEDIRRDQLRKRLAEAGRLIDKVRRAASGGFEAIERIQSRLKIIRPERLPVPVDPLTMPETAEGAPIGDFNAAGAFLAGLVREARTLLDREKSAFAARIAALQDVSEEKRRALHALLEADDLVALSDSLLLFEGPEADRPVLGEGLVNQRLERFRTRLESLSGVEIRAALEAVEEGRDYLGFPLSHLEPGRRREAETVLDCWIAVKREVRAGDASGRSVARPLVELLSTLIAEARLLEVNPLTNRTRGLFVFDIQMRIAGGPSSLLLPDFGSATGGRWRVATTQAVPALSEIVRVASGTGGDRGVIVMAPGALTLDQRRQLKVECVKHACKVLVLDEALLLETLADPERDPLAALEIAQGFTVATPYQDYANNPVPPEMFKGRAKERDEIIRPFGSSIVHGGRRLGKTALLRHIERSPRRSGAVYARLDLSGLVASDDLWERISFALREVFPHHSVRTAEGFERNVLTWLDADRERRILLMLDEADNFIHDQGDTHDWRHLHVLMRLMEVTGDRFKIVLAGLHNVSRIARGDNQPLARLSASALEIGPLFGAEAAHAESLIRGPLAALGYEFERREDVWRILSATIYYPVLIQIFCRELLRLIHERIHSTSDPLWRIGGGLVEAALTNRTIRERLGETFNKTIRTIEGRYELLTCLLTRDAVSRETESAGEEGLRLAEIAEAASLWWPAAFPQGPEPLEVAKLLEEMRGFGLVRRIEGGTGDRWALRSRMLLDLMAFSGPEEIDARLASFARQPFEPQFDPGNLRRLVAPGRTTPPRSPTSPLTESDLSTILRSGHHRRAVLVFGPPIADLDMVATALDAAATIPGVRVDVRRLSASGKTALLSALAKARGEKAVIATIGPDVPWRPDWAVEALALASVAEGRTRPIFIGGAEHAAAYAAFSAGEAARTRMERAAQVVLRPWTRSYLAARLDPLLDAFAPDLIEEILRITGGWNAPCSALLAEGAPPDAERLSRWRERLSGPDAPARLGVPDADSDVAKTLREAAGDPSLDLDDLETYCALLDPPADPAFVRIYAELMGLIRIAPNGEVRMNPLAQTVFRSGRSAGA